MTTQGIDYNKVNTVLNKSYYSLDYNIHKTITAQEEYRKNVIKNDSSLTTNEKDYLLRQLQSNYDALRIGNNSANKKQCDKCQNWYQAIQYCEYCVCK